MATPKVMVNVVDVNKSFARFIQYASRGEARKRLNAPVLLTADALAQRMKATAPVGPDDAHIRDAITFTQRGNSAAVGLLAQDFGGDSAGDGTGATMAEVALYNEYSPNKQPFMRAAAEADDGPFRRRIEDALQSIERALSSGL
jgi:hypothetical protein